MSDSQSGASDDQNGGANQNSDHKSDSENDGSKKSGDDKNEFVPKSAYEGVTKDLHKYKTRSKETERKLQETEQSLAETRERLTALEGKGSDGKNDYKSLAEKWKSKATENEQKLAKVQEGFIYSEKHRAVYGELKKLGLRDEAERLLEYEVFKDLEIETTSKGRVEVHGAKEWAGEFYNKNKFLFEPKKSPGVNSTDGRGGSSGDSDKITPAMVVEAEKKSKKSGKPEDAQAYKEIYSKYLKQKQRRA